uniref:Nucleophosmin n=1 Tax=Otolemur garnettii TaxID=30611 RepID=H0XK37_OTOGA
GLVDMDTSPWRPQNYFFNCELRADKDYPSKVDNDENGRQLSLRTVRVGAAAKAELHLVEAEAVSWEGGLGKVTLETLNMSGQPTVSPGGFEITPPVLGPERVSGQHLVAVGKDAEEDGKVLSMSGKQSTPGGGSKVPQKKVKLAAAEDENDDEEDDDDEEKAPVKRSGQNAEKSNQNGKDSKPSTPRSKGQESFQKLGKTPKTPKGPSSVEDIRQKCKSEYRKRWVSSHSGAKFIQCVKSCFMTNQEAVQGLWQCRKSV